MDLEFWTFFGVGFIAQLVDGAMGMAYGVVSSTVLLAFGVPPAQASASVHVAEVFTTAASGTSHALHRNVNWRLFRRLALPGAIGGIIGAYVLTQIDGDAIRPFITAYLAIIGAFILYKGVTTLHRVPREIGWEASPLGFAGGFLDAVGGGGWGPVVTSTLVASGSAPRQTIGTVNTAEFVVTIAISATFVIALFTGNWTGSKDIAGHAWAVGGLIAGGVLAAPVAAWVVKIIPQRTLMIMVGTLIILVAGFQTAKLFNLV
ncbi:MAG: hypothetical protein RL186_136 [Pseudomonadota bacterium]